MEEMEKDYNKERKIEVETKAKTEQFERKWNKYKVNLKNIMVQPLLEMLV